MKINEIKSLINSKKLDISLLSKLIEEEKNEYIQRKLSDYLNRGFDKEVAINKAHQSWRTYIGNYLQNLLIEILKVYLKDTDIKIIKDSNLKKKNLSKELDLVKRMLLIHFDNYSFLPDADIILYRNKTQTKTVEIICIISVKNSFRERGFETTYWKLKLNENINTKHIKVFLATPDKDNEISYIKTKSGAKKIRVVLEYELDGIYILKSDFEKTKKVKKFENIFEDIKKLIKE
jgi:type II restriction enzyme